MSGHLGRCQPGHAGGGLGLAVHDEKAPLQPQGLLGKLLCQRGFETPARLGQGLQRGVAGPVKAQPGQYLIGKGHPGKAAHAVQIDLLPEVALQHAPFVLHQGGSHQQMAVEHRQAVGVVQRQAGDGPLGRGQRQIVGDGGGVGRQIAPRQPHPLGAAGAARSRQQY